MALGEMDFGRGCESRAWRVARASDRNRAHEIAGRGNDDLWTRLIISAGNLIIAVQYLDTIRS